MKNGLLQRADIAALIARTVEATTGPARVRFCVVSSIPGMGVESRAKAVAKAIGLEVLDLRLPNVARGDFEEGGSLHGAMRKTLEGMGDAFILCSEAGFESSSPDRTGSSTARPALREVVDFLQAQDVDRDDNWCSRVVLLTTHGPAADLVEIVREVTRLAPAGFLTLD